MKTKGIPASVQEIAEVIGDEKAQALVAEFGGASFTIPADPTLDHPWVEVIGIDDWIVLCFRCGGWRLRMPTCEWQKLHERNQRLLALKEQGRKISELVREFKLTEARIYQIIAEYKEQTNV